MAVAGVGWDAAKRSPELLVVTNGTLVQISGDFQNTKDLVGFFTVNISDIIRRLRANAKKAGIDLGRRSFFRPVILASMKFSLRSNASSTRESRELGEIRKNLPSRGHVRGVRISARCRA
jgi:hypothetical protein